MSARTWKVNPDADDAEAEKACQMLADAMRERGVFELLYEFDRKFTVQDLVEIERGVNTWIVAVARALGAKLPRRRRLLRLDMASLHHVPDGKDDGKSVIVKIDFAKLAEGAA